MKIKSNNFFVVISIFSLFVLSILVLNAKEENKLVLKGTEIVTLQKNEVYQEEGVMYRNKDVTSKVNIDNDINTSKVGNYKIKYTYKTNNGKKIYTKRTVIVKE